MVIDELRLRELIEEWNRTRNNLDLSVFKINDLASYVMNAEIVR